MHRLHTSTKPFYTRHLNTCGLGVHGGLEEASWPQSFLIYRMVIVLSEGLFPVWALFLCFIDLHFSLLHEKIVAFRVSKENRNVQIIFLIWESVWALRRGQLQSAERFSVGKPAPQGQESSKNTADFVEHANEFCKSYLCVCMKTWGLAGLSGHQMVTGCSQ